ncbi:rapamycin-insensitive companion of mTOR [Drosophila miranda]|uniref:rapamycin-insensitive companion of mTOR n=1 Tax=Drosophila miranda TaxID=7229 RepID=UPI0007E78D46|nr:rapamycin-insensitive companion of mTOR [Drosophila miranda]XP_017150827.1 rapamycin-insensitive companion of mTOR [Drosophila miranda]
MASLHSSWRFGKRSKLQLRIKVSQDPEDFYRLDPTRSAAENAFDIYSMLCREETRDTKRLFLLNALASLCLAARKGSHHSNLRFSTEELLFCLSASLVHTFTQVRAAALRTIRYALSTPKDIKAFNSLQLQHLLCRSIDLMLKNDDERVQALKLVRKMLAIAPEDISPVVVRCLVSLADSGIEENDNLLRACLATLAEIAVLNPALLIVCGGVTSITRNVLECHNPRIAESLCGVLLYLLEWPQTRNMCGVRLDCLAAPYCDFTYRLGIMDKNKDARELRYTSCRLALLSVLRSWTGTLEFCDPSKPSGLQAIVDALYLNQVEVRKAILDLLYELLSLPQPAWTDDYAVALQAVDPSDFQDSWLLSNGFVSAEGRSILPSLAARAPNVVEQHLALLLYCFLETGMLNALVEVAVASDQFISVRATVLIGKILQLMHTHLPPDICCTSPALPTLIGHATQGNQQANASVAALQNYQKMLRQRPASCSLFLDSIIQGGALIQTRLFRRHLNVQEQQGPALQLQDTAAAAGSSVPLSGQFHATLDRQRLDSVSSSDESQSQSSSNSLRSSFRLKRKFMPQALFDNFRALNRLLTGSRVLTQTDANLWDWDVITTILRSNCTRKLDFTLGKFLKRLVDFYKPSNNRFSHQDLVPGHSMPAFVSAGLDLIDVLVGSRQLECMRYITDYFSDISQHLLAVTTSNRAHDCLFSPQHMNNTMCQQYFLYIGRMCRTRKGIEVLKNTTVFEYLITLVRVTDHVCYVKLIVSGLNYSFEKLPRQVLEKALTSAKTRSGRLYATQFMAVLLRARLPHFEVWGIPLIILQTKDADRSVVLAAMEVLEEACHDKYYLEEIVSLWPNLTLRGDVGRLLMSRYYSLSRGLNSSLARIEDEIKYWRNGYNKRYVLLVEADTHSSLTLHIRNEDGYYSRRNCNQRPQTVPPNIAPHLYGQMVQTSQGMTALSKFGDLPQLLDLLTRAKCTDDAECLELKAAVWALSHASTHANGIEYFVEQNARLYEKLIVLVTKCEVYSVRATCFSALGLIAGTQAGANILFKLNWLSVRHDRNTMWPVHQPEDWMSNQYTPVRHYYEDAPPYNFTVLEDQIDGSYYTGSYYWNLLIDQTEPMGVGTGTGTGTGTAVGGGIQDPNSTATTTTMDDGHALALHVNRTLSGPVAAAKSKTLPEGSNLRQGKHQRSLSESKTTDVISLLGGGGGGGTGGGLYPMPYQHQHQHQQQHRIRYNSCTDSNTSGVSSCESVTGRTAAAAAAAAANMSELQQFPLSPIPSMSNLLESEELIRLHSIATSHSGTANTTLSPMAVKGYAQLRVLRAHSRPVLESAAELHDFIHKQDWSYPKPRLSKVRRRLSTGELNVLLPTLNAPKFLPQNDMQGPCYAGICLPKNVLDLFPTRNLSRTYVSRDIQDQDLMGINLLLSQRLQFLNDSLNNEGGDESSVISSLSDVSSASRRQPRQWQQGAKHARSQCLHCARSPRQQRQDSVGSQSNGAGAGGGATLAPCELYSSAAAALVAAGIQAGPVLAKKSSGSGGSGSGRVPLGTDISFHSPESMLSEDSLPDRLTASILYNVQRLANPVSAKQSKMALLELKQKHPHAFQDICLYSESCKTLGRSSYRMSARRFLQELFLDLNFDAFYVEPQLIIGTRKMPAEEKAEPTPPSAMLLAHKTQMKPKPAAQLASVYETSWENLLMDQSPRMVVSKSPSANAQQASQQQMMPHNQLHIKDDTEDTLEDSEDEEEGDENEDDDPGEDVCDGSGAGTQASSVTTAHTALPCHGNSNRSSICTISQQPVPQPPAVPGGGATGTAGTNLKNDNRQYTRGRFYTLELDLSCTKNKFPIKDRSQTTPPKTSPTPVPQLKRQMSADADADADADTDAGVVSSISVAPGSTSSTLDYSTVTKSLAASMTKPVGSLYCEKRLQSSKSEAVLDARAGAGPASGTGGAESAVGGSSRNGSVKWTSKRVTS